jgi:hypothetical protein
MILNAYGMNSIFYCKLVVSMNKNTFLSELYKRTNLVLPGVASVKVLLNLKLSEANLAAEMSLNTKNKAKIFK